MDYLDPTSINGLNLYAYCNNDPVNYSDRFGHQREWWETLLIGIGIVAGIAALGTLTVLTGGASTGILAVVNTVASSAFWGATSGAILGGVSGAIDYKSGSDTSLFDSIINGMMEGSISGAITGAASGLLTYVQLPATLINKTGQAKALFKTINASIQFLGQGALSYASTLLQGGSEAQARMSFVFGAFGGAIGSNSSSGGNKLGESVKDIFRVSLIQLGPAFSEYILDWRLNI